MYSRGGDGCPIAEDWNTVLTNFKISVKAIHGMVRTPKDIASLSKEQKKAFLQLFRNLDNDFAHLKAFTKYDESMLDGYDFSEEQYEDFAAMYKNVVEELKKDKPDNTDDEPEAATDYDLKAYSKLRIDFEYIIELLQGIVETLNQDDNNFEKSNFEYQIKELRAIMSEFTEENPRLGELINQVIDEIEQDKNKYIGQDIFVIINEMRTNAINKEVAKFASKWYLDPEDVKYEAYKYRDGVIANENNLKENADYARYKADTEDALPKFKFRKLMIDDFKNDLMENILPLIW